VQYPITAHRTRATDASVLYGQVITLSTGHTAFVICTVAANLACNNAVRRAVKYGTTCKNILGAT